MKATGFPSLEVFTKNWQASQTNGKREVAEETEIQNKQD
jgi:hypothetical protein